MSLRILCLLFCAITLTAGFSPAQVAPGFQKSSLTLAPGSQTVGGLEATADGTFYFFDGNSIYRQKGTQKSKIYTPKTKVYGSFIRKIPKKSAILFGESSQGTITEISTGVLPYFRKVATIAFNYDAVFGPLGEILVSAPTGSTPPRNAVYLVNDKTGATDKLVEVSGYSGPVTLDKSGNLILGAVADKWPTPPAAARILTFTSAQWRGAVGPTHLVEKDAQILASGLNSVAYLALDGTDRVLFTDTSNKTVWALTPKGKKALYSPGTETPTYLAYMPESGSAWFRSYQPSGGGKLLCLATAWGSTNRLDTLISLRPHLQTPFSGPIPGQTKFPLWVKNGPPQGVAFLLFATQWVQPETRIFFPGLDFPLFMGLAPTNLFFSATLSLDNQGKGTWQGYWPGGYNTKLYLQAFVLQGTALEGSSEPYLLMLGV